MTAETRFAKALGNAAIHDFVKAYPIRLSKKKVKQTLRKLGLIDYVCSCKSNG